MVLVDTVVGTTSGPELEAAAVVVVFVGPTIAEGLLNRVAVGAERL